MASDEAPGPAVEVPREGSWCPSLRPPEPEATLGLPGFSRGRRPSEGAADARSGLPPVRPWPRGVSRPPAEREVGGGPPGPDGPVLPGLGCLSSGESPVGENSWRLLEPFFGVKRPVLETSSRLVFLVLLPMKVPRSTTTTKRPARLPAIAKKVLRKIARIGRNKHAYFGFPVAGSGAGPRLSFSTYGKDPE